MTLHSRVSLKLGLEK